MADVSKMRDLCSVLGISLLQRIRDEVDDSTEDVDSWLTSHVRVETSDRLKSSVERLFKIKLERYNELRRRGLAILSYWDALHVSFEEKQEFIRLAYYVGVESVNEITGANSLSLEFIDKVEQEYHKLHEQLNVVVQQQKSKLKILKSTHLSSSFTDKDTSDLVMTPVDTRTRISEAEAWASKRASLVTKIQFVMHATEEVQRYKAAKKDDVPHHDATSTKARFLQKALPEIVSKLKAELAAWDGAFKYDEKEYGRTEKATNVEDQAGTSADKTVEGDMAGTSTEKNEEDKTIGVEATGVEDMQLDSEQSLPQLLQFGRRAPRTPRVPVQAVPQSPPSPPDSDKSTESMMSAPSVGSSMSRSDPDDSDYDPERDT